jgi:hypothetical protein
MNTATKEKVFAAVKDLTGEQRSAISNQKCTIIRVASQIDSVAGIFGQCRASKRDRSH